MTLSARHRCMDGVEAGPNLAARRLVMAALLYYDFGTNIMTDGEYDRLGEFVRDNFADIGETMQFCIGADWAYDDGLSGWTASGAQFKITQRVYHGALAWARHLDIGVENVYEWKMVDFDMATGIEFSKLRG